jgi:hypothetical protein
MSYEKPPARDPQQQETSPALIDETQRENQSSSLMQPKSRFFSGTRGFILFSPTHDIP